MFRRLVAPLPRSGRTWRAARGVARPHRRSRRLSRRAGLKRLVDVVARRHGLSEWHRSMPWERSYLMAAARWIARNVPPGSGDRGCGTARPFVLPHPHGFGHFLGIDIEPAVIAAARDLLTTVGMPADLEVRDALAPLDGARPDVLVTTNWHHSVKNGLPSLATLAAAEFGPGGLWLFDALPDPPPPLYDPHALPHREGFSRPAVVRMLEDAGLGLRETINCSDRTVSLAVKLPAGTDA